MGRSLNSLETSGVTVTPVKLKYSSSYSDSALYDHGIIILGGTNTAINLNGGNTQEAITYKSIEHLYYSNFLTGSFPVSASGDDNWLQSTAALTRTINYDASLVFSLDAGNLASYPGTGTKWYDASGSGYVATLINGPTYQTNGGGSIRFTPGSSQYATMNYTQPGYTAASSFTWNVWVYVRSSPGIYIIIGSRAIGIPNFTKLTTAQFEYYPNGISYYMNPNAWRNICVVKSGTDLYYYANGVLQAQTTSTQEKILSPFYIGGDPGVDEYIDMDIAVVQVYDKALSSGTVLSNYNATKARFGL